MDGGINYMITTKTVYQVTDDYYDIVGIHISDNPSVRNMDLEEALKQGNSITGAIIDESIRDYIIYTFLDAPNYGLEDDEYVEIKWEELINEYCTPIRMIVNNA
jgi:hypothetical protein